MNKSFSLKAWKSEEVRLAVSICFGSFSAGNVGTETTVSTLSECLESFEGRSTENDWNWLRLIEMHIWM